MSRLLRALVGVLTAPLVLAGCGSAKVAVSDAPAPSAPMYTCAAPSGPPTPCTPEQYAKLEIEDQVGQEAIAVYNRLFTELYALERGGGGPTPSAELTNVAGGPYLAGQVATLAKLAELKAKVTGTVALKKAVAVTGASARGYDAAVFACVDATKAQAVAGASIINKGQLVAETVFFKREGTNLKAWDAEKADPASCG